MALAVNVHRSEPVQTLEHPMDRVWPSQEEATSRQVVYEGACSSSVDVF
jgi:hypothetical protein